MASNQYPDLSGVDWLSRATDDNNLSRFHNTRWDHMGAGMNRPQNPVEGGGLLKSLLGVLGGGMMGPAGLALGGAQLGVDAYKYHKGRHLRKLQRKIVEAQARRAQARNRSMMDVPYTPDSSTFRTPGARQVLSTLIGNKRGE